MKTYQQAAAQAGVTVWFLRRKVAEGRLKVRRFGHRTVRIADSELDKFIRGATDV